MVPQKIVLVFGGWEKVPQKDRVQSSEGQKKGVKTAAHAYNPT